MSLAATRLASGFLVLLACLIAAWRSADHTPRRMVVELVSVVTVPARVEASAATDPPIAPIAAPAAQTVAVRVAPPRKPLARRAPMVVQHAKAVPREEPANARPAKAAVRAPAVVKVSCRPPACHTATAAKKTVLKPVIAQEERKAEQPVPAVFVPLRNLGLRLQARVNPPQEAKTAPGKRKPESQG